VCLVYGPSRLAVQAKKIGHAKETWPSFGWMPKFGGQPSHILINKKKPIVNSGGQNDLPDFG